MKVRRFSWPPKKISKEKNKFCLIEADNVFNLPFSDLMVGDVLNYGRVIVSGEKSEIRLCMHSETNVFFCVKIQPYNGEKNKKELLDVASLQKSLEHPAIVKMYTSLMDDRNLYHIMEYLPLCDLFQRISAVGALSESVTKNYTAQLVLALDYIHESGFVHNDIKLEHLLIDKEGDIKLTDFSLALPIGQTTSELVRGTPQYMSPERINDERLEETSDWWSVGICCFEMLAGYLPFGMRDADNPKNIFSKILHSELLIPSSFSDDAAEFISGLLSKNKNDRLGCDGVEDLQEHPWLDDIDWDNLLPTVKEPPVTFVSENNLEEN